MQYIATAPAAMPELPEVESIRRSLLPLLGSTVVRVEVRQPLLRWPVSGQVSAVAAGQLLTGLERRGKYLLMRLQTATLIWHFGMSGSLNLVKPGIPPGKHDHVDVELALVGQQPRRGLLRLTDPRRFGALLLTRQPPLEHPLLRALGPEPLDQPDLGLHLYTRARGRRAAVKGFLMDSRVVVGVGNIYATEALFSAGIAPRRAAGRVSLVRYRGLALAVQTILREAITAKGTTIKDHLAGDGTPGGYAVALRTYGRGGQPCLKCGSPLISASVGQRGTVWCRRCQR